MGRYRINGSSNKDYGGTDNDNMVGVLLGWTVRSWGTMTVNTLKQGLEEDATYGNSLRILAPIIMIEATALTEQKTGPLTSYVKSDAP